jgi:hypothetical protein
MTVVKPSRCSRSRANRYNASATRAVSPTRKPKREPDTFAARSSSKRPISVCSFGSASCGGSPQRLISTPSSSVIPSAADSCGGFGTFASAASRAASASASSASSSFNRALRAFSSSSCSGVGFPCTFCCARSSSTCGTSSRQRASAAISASKDSAAPRRARAARKRAGSWRAAWMSIIAPRMPQSPVRHLLLLRRDTRSWRASLRVDVRSRLPRRSPPSRSAPGRSRRRRTQPCLSA